MNLCDIWTERNEQPSRAIKAKESAEIAAQIEQFLAAGGRIQKCGAADESEMTLEERVIYLCRKTALNFDQIGKRCGITAKDVNRIARNARLNYITLSKHRPQF